MNSLNIETPITVRISSRAAGLISNDLQKYVRKAADHPDTIDKIQTEMRGVVDSLQSIYKLNTQQRMTWTISLALMRTAVTWITKVLTQLRVKEPNENLSTIHDELADIAKNAIGQIESAGDIEFVEFLEHVSPGFMMELKHGVDPLQGTAGF